MHVDSSTQGKPHHQCTFIINSTQGKPLTQCAFKVAHRESPTINARSYQRGTHGKPHHQCAFIVAYGMNRLITNTHNIINAITRQRPQILELILADYTLPKQYRHRLLIGHCKRIVNMRINSNPISKNNLIRIQ